MKVTIKNTFVDCKEAEDEMTPTNSPPRAKTEGAMANSYVSQEDEEDDADEAEAMPEDLRSSTMSAGPAMSATWSDTPQSGLYASSGTAVRFFPATSPVGMQVQASTQADVVLPLQSRIAAGEPVKVTRSIPETQAPAQAQPYIVKNTFIDLDDPESDGKARDNRRLKTMPASALVADEDDMEKDMPTLCPTLSAPLQGHLRASTETTLPQRVSAPSPVSSVGTSPTGGFVQSVRLGSSYFPQTAPSAGYMQSPLMMQQAVAFQSPLMVHPTASVAPMPQPFVAALQTGTPTAASSPSATSTPSTAAPGRVVSITASPTNISPGQPYVIKNTFIDVGEMSPIERRDGRRFKTVPAMAPAFADLLDEDDDKAITASEPTKRFAYSASEVPLQLQPVRSVASTVISASQAPAMVPVPVTLSTMTVPTSVAGRVWALSQENEGCRQVQKALEAGSGNSDEARAAMVAELQGHVREGLANPHANFVLRKCVTDVPWPAVKFFIDELLAEGPEAVQEAARHRYGCRIIEALLMHCPVSNTNPMGEVLLADAVGLGTHMYGNFVIQRLLSRDSPAQQSRLRQLLVGNVGTLGPNFYGSTVLGAALRTGSPEEQVLLARIMVGTAGLLAAIIRFKHGNQIKERVLELLPETERAQVEAQLSAVPLRAPAGAKAAAAPSSASSAKAGAVRSVQITQQPRKAKVMYKSPAIAAPAMGAPAFAGPPGVFLPMRLSP